jgi:hypothetical protein
MRAASPTEATPMAKLRMLLAAAMLGTLLMVPATASAAKPTTSGLTVPISGTVADVSSFVGTFDLSRVAVQNGELVAVGTLTGTLTDLDTGGTQQVSQAVTLPLAVDGTCEILHLTLGPLDLNLLGLMVHLDQVVLNIDAQSGPGNLLGNLLCGIAGLLDGNAPLSAIARILNNLLALLG